MHVLERLQKALSKYTYCLPRGVTGAHLQEITIFTANTANYEPK